MRRTLLNRHVAPRLRGAQIGGRTNARSYRFAGSPPKSAVGVATCADGPRRTGRSDDPTAVPAGPGGGPLTRGGCSGSASSTSPGAARERPAAPRRPGLSGADGSVRVRRGRLVVVRPARPPRSAAVGLGLTSASPIRDVGCRRAASWARVGRVLGGVGHGRRARSPRGRAPGRCRAARPDPVPRLTRPSSAVPSPAYPLDFMAAACAAAAICAGGRPAVALRLPAARADRGASAAAAVRPPRCRRPALLLPPLSACS